MLPYLTIGGSRETFWKLRPKDIEIDFRAYKKKMEIQDQLMWKQGWYVKCAIQSSVMMCTLAEKRNIKNMPNYPDMPLTEEEEKEQEQNNEAKKVMLIAKMKYWQRKNNSKI